MKRPAPCRRPPRTGVLELSARHLDRPGHDVDRHHRSLRGDAHHQPCHGGWYAPGALATLQDPDGFSNLRAALGTRSTIITRLPQGQSLERLREEDGWRLVRTPEGQTGWVHGSRLMGVP